MKIEDEILVNQYAQDIVDAEPILERFNSLNIEDKRYYLKFFIGFCIIQSKPTNDDIEQAISDSLLKPTFTPCVLLRKGGVAMHNLEKIAKLPEDELNKVLRLFLALFRIAYLRRYEVEKGSYKWWYWDLSDEENVKKVMNNEY